MNVPQRRKPASEPAQSGSPLASFLQRRRTGLLAGAVVLAAISREPDGSGRPRVIVAHTVKGKGVSFMEDDNNWHYRIPTADEVRKARVELGQPEVRA